MKVILSKDTLVKGLNTVSRAVPVRTTMEILKCVLLEAEEGYLKMVTNDTSLGIETKMAAFVEEAGSVAVDAVLFSSIIRKLPDNDVVIEADAQKKIRISCENARFSIAGRGTEEFIYLPDVDVRSSVTVSQFTVREMINEVIFSTSDSNLNAAMAGVYMEVFDDNMKMTTLDGHRISIRKTKLQENAEKNAAIIPSKTLNDLSKIANGDLDSPMTISFSKNHIQFSYDETRMVSRVIDGDYFRIDAMLVHDHKTAVKVNKRELLDCLDRSTLLISESDHKPVIIEISEEQMVLRLKSAIGDMRETIAAEKTGEDLKIAFNPKFLIDALRVISDEEVNIYFISFNYPCTIKDEEGSYTYVILPVNFTED